MNKVLCVVAHGDDEVLGCGGTIAKLANQGQEVHVAVLCENSNRHNNPKISCVKSSEQAKVELGYAKLWRFELSDQGLDQENFCSLVGIGEHLIDEIKPELLIIHNGVDLNRDHRIAHEVMMVAARTQRTKCEIWEMPVLPLSIRQGREPNTWVDVPYYAAYKKLRALGCYSGEVMPFPHVRSIKGLLATMVGVGGRVGSVHAEEFCLLRSIRG